MAISNPNRRTIETVEDSFRLCYSDIQDSEIIDENIGAMLDNSAAKRLLLEVISAVLRTLHDTDGIGEIGRRCEYHKIIHSNGKVFGMELYYTVTCLEEKNDTILTITYKFILNLMEGEADDFPNKSELDELHECLPVVM